MEPRWAFMLDWHQVPTWNSRPFCSSAGFEKGLMATQLTCFQMIFSERLAEECWHTDFWGPPAGVNLVLNFNFVVFMAAPESLSVPHSFYSKFGRKIAVFCVAALAATESAASALFERQAAFSRAFWASNSNLWNIFHQNCYFQISKQ